MDKNFEAFKTPDVVNTLRPSVTNTPENHPFPNLYKLGKEKHGLFIGCPIWRHTEMEWHVAMTQFYALAFNLGIHFYDMPMVNDALIQRSRSRSASDFLKTDAQVFVQIDGDIAFNPIDVLKIAEKAFEYNIVGGAYVKRMQEKTELAIRTWKPTEIEFTDDQHPVEVEFLSGGFYAVHRRVLETMLRTHARELPLCHAKDMAFYPFYADKLYKEGDNTLFLSEDWAFFQRAREAGFTSYVDPTVRLGHVGNYTYTLEDIARRPRPALQAMKFTRDKDGLLHIEGQGAPASNEIVTTADGFQMHIIPGDMMISESIRTTGYWDKPVRDALLEQLHRPVTSEELAKGPSVFLDLGAHIGYYSLFAAWRGARVIAVEPNPVMYELLNKSIELNKNFDIQAWNCAVSSFDGKGSLKTEGLQNNGESYLVNNPDGPINVLTLESLLAGEYPDIVKIDIEGEEWDVLVNASDEFWKHLKVLIFELSEPQLRRQTNGEWGALDLLTVIESRGFKVSKIQEHSTYADWLAVK